MRWTPGSAWSGSTRSSTGLYNDVELDLEAGEYVIVA